MLLSVSVLIALGLIFGGLFTILLICFTYSIFNKQAIDKQDSIKKNKKRIIKKYRSEIFLNKTKNTG